MTDHDRAAVPIALPFDDEGDVPVPFALTAAGHRALGATGVPSLRVVPDHPVGEGRGGPADHAAAPDDLRPAQARALRRSGMRVATIAAAMGVDAADVLGWTADVPADRVGGPRPAATRPAGAARTPGRVSARPVTGRHHAAAAGLAVAVAQVEAGDAAVVLAHDRPAVLATALGAVRERIDLEDAAIRVAARASDGAGADRVHAELAGALGLSADRIVVGRGGPDAAGPSIRIRIADARAVAVVDAWASALLERPARLSTAN